MLARPRRIDRIALALMAALELADVEAPAFVRLGEIEARPLVPHDRRRSRRPHWDHRAEGDAVVIGAQHHVHLALGAAMLLEMDGELVVAVAPGRGLARDHRIARVGAGPVAPRARK